MPSSRPANTVYELCDAVPVRRALGAKLLLLLDIWQGTISAEPPVEHRVIVRDEGLVVYRVKTDSAAAYIEARKSISQNLQNLTVSEFETEYSIRTDPPPTMSAYRRLGTPVRLGAVTRWAAIRNLPERPGPGPRSRDLDPIRQRFVTGTTVTNVNRCDCCRSLATAWRSSLVPDPLNSTVKLPTSPLNVVLLTRCFCRK